MLKYETVKQKERQLLALTGLTVVEFETLEGAFSTTWQAEMGRKTMDGRPRVERAHSDYANSPLPTGAQKLLFILIYLKQAPTQTLHGSLFAMSQSNANKWIHLLLPILNQTLATLGERPARQAEKLLAQWEAARNAAACVADSAPTPVDEAPSTERDDLAALSAPLFTRTAPNDRSSAPAMGQMSATAARRNVTP